ncbi:MAG: DNA gyrase inhibitor YacG [Devosia sp.]
MAEIIRLKPARKCPICGKPSTQANYPFCSPRCQDIDLNRWLSDAYRIPTAEGPEPLPDKSEGDQE